MALLGQEGYKKLQRTQTFPTVSLHDTGCVLSVIQLHWFRRSFAWLHLSLPRWGELIDASRDHKCQSLSSMLRTVRLVSWVNGARLRFWPITHFVQGLERKGGADYDSTRSVQRYQAWRHLSVFAVFSHNQWILSRNLRHQYGQEGFGAGREPAARWLHHLLSPHIRKKTPKKTKKLSKGILTCGSSMTILCHFPSSRILIRIMWCYKVAAESAFSGESRCLGSSAHSEENTYVTDVWSKSKWPVKSHVICRIIREWSEKSWQCPGLKRNTHMHTQTTKMYLKDSIRCTRTENAFGDA